jgi:ArsR family transcriptional regulator, arsenate/arsenite/antimonite-responsive transcriptional repressor
MDTNLALSAFDALGQPTRLMAFRALVQAGKTGLSASEVADQTATIQNTMSAHLSILLASGLVRNQRHGRTIRYFADMDGVRLLLEFLLEDCCGGQPDLCRPLIETVTCAC